MQLRPARQFTPPKNWMNDPNGLIYHEGLYHLYYQHNPLVNAFGNISWGHATSRDLQQWSHHAVALRHTSTSMMYSGCTVIDQQGRVCAIYTEHLGDTQQYRERICLARSEDGGFTFNQRESLVVLEHPDPDFRDPKTFWYEPDGCWVMVVSLPKKYTILFYRSFDLISWQQTGAFSSPKFRGQYWECPDLFPLEDEHGNISWILSLSGENPDQQSWGMFFFQGTFNGRAFTATSPGNVLDYGKDFYAGITFAGLPTRIMMGWCGNWAYADQPQDKTWSGMMSTPRRLYLKNGALYQELITDVPLEQLTVLASIQEREIQGCRIRWSARHLQVDRSGSKRNYPTEHRMASYQGEIRQLSILVDVGLLECAINEGAQLFTLAL